MREILEVNGSYKVHFKGTNTSMRGSTDKAQRLENDAVAAFVSVNFFPQFSFVAT